MELLSVTKYGKRHGVTKQAASKWNVAGYLVLIGKKVDVEASDVKLKEFMLGRFSPDKLVDGSAELVDVPVDVPVDDSVDRLTVGASENAAAVAERILSAGGAKWDFAEARRVKENYLALLNQLDYDIKSGEVVLVADVAKEVGEQFAMARTRLLAIPANHAPRLFNKRSVSELNDALYGYIVDALEELTLK